MFFHELHWHCKEYTPCQVLGGSCGPIFESRYQTFVNTGTIDLASVGVNTLRIPTTYAAWINVSGSAFCFGNQIAHLRRIIDYAIRTYGMNCIIGLHSLSGDVNNLDISEGLINAGIITNLTGEAFCWTSGWVVDHIGGSVRSSA
jgi:glucan 1,3-beta-glucosidase